MEVVANGQYTYVCSCRRLKMCPHDQFHSFARQIFTCPDDVTCPHLKLERRIEIKFIIKLNCSAPTLCF